MKTLLLSWEISVNHHSVLCILQVEGTPGFPHGPAQGSRAGCILGPPSTGMAPAFLWIPKGRDMDQRHFRDFPGYHGKGMLARAEITWQVLFPCRNETNPYRATGKNSLNHMLDAGKFASTFNIPFNLPEDPQRWLGSILPPPTNCILQVSKLRVKEKMKGRATSPCS